MGDSNSSDVDRALAAFGATPINYRSFGRHQLRPEAAHVAAPAALGDTVYDPFAPQPLMHSMDETQPDVLLPVRPPAIEGPVAEPAARDEATRPRLPAIEDLTPDPPVEELPRPAPARHYKPVIEGVQATRAAPPPEAVHIGKVAAVPAQTPIAPPVAAALPAVPWPSPAPSLPTLGAQFVSRESAGARGLDSDAPPCSLSEMFRILNGRPDLARPMPAAARSGGVDLFRRP